jgi:hypothetical protein
LIPNSEFQARFIASDAVSPFRQIIPITTRRQN